jgi:uncharacterized membrane protein YraQ (UPF0718 family)
MKQFLQKHAKGLKYASLIVMLIVPFLLYSAARSDIPWAVNLLLGLMGASMLVAMKIG